MWIPMTEQYQQEKTQYNLKECCEDCSYYCPIRNKCAMLYPTEPHRKEAFDKAACGERIYFCKMFEAK
jgi:hypothetical protein